MSERDITIVGSSIPFGLAVAAREPVPVEDVDFSALVYDTDRQIMLIPDGVTSGLMPWCKHSTGKTNTNSNTDGKGGPETDEDYTED
ncbi:MAG: putative ATP-grasp-modified RiPP [Pseudonocardiaceae bacterium]